MELKGLEQHRTVSSQKVQAVLNALDLEFRPKEMAVEELFELLKLKEHIRIYLRDVDVKHDPSYDYIFKDDAQSLMKQKILGGKHLMNARRFYVF